MNPYRKIVAVVGAALLVVGLASCSDDSDVADKNITKAAKNFEISRRILVVNGITDKIQLQVDGRCNVNPKKDRIFITCKVKAGEGNDSYLRHAVYKSDNVYVVVEQGKPIKVSAYSYRFTFKPQTLIPDPDFRGESGEGPQAQP